MGKISRKQLPINIKVTRNRTIGPRRNNRRIYFNLARPALNRIRQGKQEKRRLVVVNQLYSDMTSQIGSGMGSNILKAGLNLESKALGSEFGKELINKGIDDIPNIFKFGASKVKNKKTKKALKPEIADMVVNEAQGTARKKYNSTNLFG